MSNLLKFLIIFLLIEILFATKFSFLSLILFFSFIFFESFGKTKSFKKLLEALFLLFIFFSLAKDYSFPYFHFFALLSTLMFFLFFWGRPSYYFPAIYFLFLIFFKHKFFPLFFGIFIYFSLVWILGRLFSLASYQRYLLSFLLVEISIPISFLSLPPEIKSLIVFLFTLGGSFLFSKKIFRSDFLER